MRSLIDRMLLVEARMMSQAIGSDLGVRYVRCVAAPIVENGSGWIAGTAMDVTEQRAPDSEPNAANIWRKRAQPYGVDGRSIGGEIVCPTKLSNSTDPSVSPHWGSSRKTSSRRQSPVAADHGSPGGQL
jgi:hypothetical protein